jgi:DNA-binding transcriptional LysR family regulator
MIDLDALHSFAVFSRTRNFTRAAEELHISQPALHVKIAKLGRSLDVALYRRRGRELELTAAGQQLARFGSETRRSVDEFVARLRGLTPEDPAVLAAGEGTLLYLLAPVIRQWQQRKGAALKILTRDREGALDAVRSGEAQVGVAALETVPDDLEAMPLVQARPIVVLPSRHRLTRKRELQPEDLRGASMIVPPAGRPHREAFTAAMASAGIGWVPAVEAAGWPLMLELTRQGLGLAVVNSTCVLPAGLSGRPLRGMPATQYRAFYGRGTRSEATQALITAISALKAKSR